MALLYKLRQELEHGGHALWAHEHIDQLLAADDAPAHLPQLKHDAHRNAVFLQVRIDCVGRIAA